MDVSQLGKSTQTVVIQGWVFKKSRYIGSWRKRYLVLTPIELLTFKSDRKEQQPTEAIKLHHIQFILQSEDVLPQFDVIEIKTHDREYKFGFSPEERVQWQGRIARAISRLLNSPLRDNLVK